jgi:trimeric autotransporter adhesin
VTVAEVAGIIVTAQGALGAFVPGGIAYFDFTIINVGNDPTQFFIPDGPSAIVGGTQRGDIQIMSYDADGSGAAVDLTSNNIYVTTAGGATTGSLLNGIVGTNNGSIPPGGTITVRVSINITGTVGTNVSVTLGDTPVPPNVTSQNQSFVLGNKDVYTVDNVDPARIPGEAAGIPINGDSVNHRQEASAKLSASIFAPPIALSGRVFEDVNYGGGAGRNLMAAAGIVRANVRMELYDAAGAFKGFTTTDALGAYTFDSINIAGGISAGNYTVRVVNSTVTSSRPNPLNTMGLLPIQTFRTDASTGTVIADPNRVGGEIPNEVDAPANSGSQTLATINTGSNEAESIAPVKVVSSNVTGIDFGFNFDTIVNTNNSGQGSLRQFILNSNALANSGLAQVGQSTGKEVSIFMISDGFVHPGLRSGLTNQLTTTGGNNGAAVINLTSNLSITDADTSLDGTTQTTNVGDRNAGNVGTSGTVGVDNLPLNTVPRPEVVLNLTGVPANTNAIIVTGSNTLLKGFASYGYRTTSNLATTLKAAIVVKSNITDANATTITQLLGGTLADGSDPGVPTIDVGYTIQTEGAANISNNFLAYNSNAIEFANTNGSKVDFSNNEVAYNGPRNNNTSNASGIYADQMETWNGAKNITLRGNLVRNSSKPNYPNAQGQGIQISYGSNITVDNNTLIDNNAYGINASSSDTTITKNIITGTKATGLGIGDGIVVYHGGGTGLRNRISQNSIYQNAKLGIDFAANAIVDANDGVVNATQANNGMDYPIITSSTLDSGTLTVKGFVGNNQNGSTIFANATLEFFIADDDGNQNGQVIVGDGKSKPHGEGKTYIGTCSTNANSLFNCSFNNTVTLGMTSPNSITATATDIAGNTSEFGTVWSDPNVLLVKRITAMNGSTTTVNGDDLAIYKNTSSPYDDNVKENPPFINQPNPNQDDTTFWPNPASFLLGGINGGNIKPGYEMDYTIYFLSTGNTSARSTELCDRIPSNQDFVPTAFNSATAASGGSIGGNRGILVSIGGTATAHTNLSDGDMARYYEPGEILPTSCGTGANTNGAILVNLGIIPAATAPGIPANSSGFVRFRVKMR